MPTWTRLVAGAFLMLVAWNHGVHPLVEVRLLGVDVAVEVDDPDVAVEVRRQPADRREPDRVVAAEHDRHRTALDDVRHRLADLVEGLLQVGRDGEDVSEVDHVQLLAQVHPELVGVGAEQVGRAPDALGAEPRAGAVGRTRVERHPEERDLGVSDVVHVLHERRLEEGPGLAREVRQLAAHEGRDASVDDRRCGLEPMGEPAVDLLLEPLLRQPSLGLPRLTIPDAEDMLNRRRAQRFTSI